MSIHRSLFLLTLRVFLASLRLRRRPPHRRSVATRRQERHDEYDGWLFNSLTGTARSGRGTAGSFASDLRSTHRLRACSRLRRGRRRPRPQDRWWPGRRAPPVRRRQFPPSFPRRPSGAISISAVKLKEGGEEEGFRVCPTSRRRRYTITSRSAAGYGPDEKIARADMEEGKVLFQDKKFKEAGRSSPRPPTAGPTRRWKKMHCSCRAKASFSPIKYPKAHDTFGGLLKKYPNTRHLDTAIAREFAMGRYWEQLYTPNPPGRSTPT